jgi:tetratricopeptide (TPR) repeat protein
MEALYEVCAEGALRAMDDADAEAKAHQLHLQAAQRYVKINAHVKVYRSRNAETEQLARNGIEFIEGALKLVPNNATYLNTYALLLADGLGNQKVAMEILERAARLDPDNIQIRQNIRDLQSAGPAARALDPAIVVVIFIALAVAVAIAVALVAHG